MKIVVAPDSLKGCLGADAAARALAAGIKRALPSADVTRVPLADGGEGTIAALRMHLPHPTEIPYDGGHYLLFEEDERHGALLEAAQLLGLHNEAMRRVAILRRGSGALGRCLIAAFARNTNRCLVGLGGTATNDGGLGMLMTLGLCATDRRGRPVSPDLAGLIKTRAVDGDALDPGLRGRDLIVLNDVEAPLNGPRGATLEFGPQKGLAGTQLAAAEDAMTRFADLCAEAFGADHSGRPGAGAAGGLGFAFLLIGARLRSGADFVIETTDLGATLRDADWVVTAEGRADRQTLSGKLPLRVAQLARGLNVPTSLIAGAVDENARPALEEYFDRVLAASPRGAPDEAISVQGAAWLSAAAERWAAGL